MIIIATVGDTIGSMFSDNITGYLIIIGGIAGALIILALLLRSWKNRAKGKSQARNTSGAVHPKRRLDYQPESPSVQLLRARQTAIRKSRETASPPAGKERDLIRGSGNLFQSLAALAEKYSFEEITLATPDGLVFASSGSERSVTDAAVYSSMYAGNPRAKSPGVVLFDLSFEGSGLTGIIRSSNPISGKQLGGITADIQAILTHWVRENKQEFQE